MNVTKAAHHFSVEEVRKMMDEATCPLYRKRWRIIYHALVDPQPAEVIALHCGAAKDTVHKLISHYNRFGLAAIETSGKGEEEDFISLSSKRSSFYNLSLNGQQREKLRPALRSMQPMKPVLTDLLMRVPFIGFLLDMGGEKSSHAPGIQKPRKNSKKRLKQLLNAC